MEFVPVVYEHAASFLGKRPWEVSRSGDLLFEAHAAAYRVYGHAPVVLGIDVYNLEAEAYGGKVEDAGGNEVPTVSGQICAASAEVPTLRRFSPEHGGRFPMILEAGARFRKAFPGVEIRVPLSGPFSILTSLLGFQETLLEMLLNPLPVASALGWLAEGQVHAGQWIAGCGFPVMVFESSASPPMVSPGLYRSVIQPALHQLIRGLRVATGEGVPLILGGDTSRILPELLETGTGYLICPPETDREAFMEQMRRHPSVEVRMNTPPRLYLGREPEAVEAELRYLASLAGGRPMTCIGTGVLPYDADPGAVLHARDLARPL